MADNDGVADPNARRQEAVGSIKVMLSSLRPALQTPFTKEFRSYTRQGWARTARDPFSQARAVWFEWHQM